MTDNECQFGLRLSPEERDLLVKQLNRGRLRPERARDDVGGRALCRRLVVLVAIQEHRRQCAMA
jgi:hypothetical protein